MRADDAAMAAGLPDHLVQEINRLWTIVRAFSTAAHDVNNSLQVIAGSAELLAASPVPLDPRVERRLAAIREQAGRAAEVIDRLLTYARPEIQGPRRTDLGTLVDTAAGMRASTLGHGNISLDVERSRGGSAFVTGEPRKLLQALLDMLLAAEDAVQGAKKGRIAIRIDRDDTDAHVVVCASGEAASPEADPSADPPSSAVAVASAQIRVAEQLASVAGGSLEAKYGCDPVLTIALRLPLDRPAA